MPEHLSQGETWPCGHRRDNPDPKCHCCATHQDEPVGQSEPSRHESLAERTMREVYGYTRRPGQSINRVVVPVALLQEAMDSCPPGDAQEILFRILTRAEVLDD